MLAAAAALFSLLALPLSTAQAPAVTLTPWCANSFRVQVAPPASAFSPATAAARAALDATLARHVLADLPGALIPDCGPGAPVTPAPGGAAAASGNLLAAARAADGALVFSRADTGQVLLTAAVSLGPQTFANSCVVGAVAAGNDVYVADNMTLAAAAAWCAANATCAAFTSEAAASAVCGAALDDSVGRRVYFKSVADSNGDAAWLTWTKPGASGGFLVASVNATAGDPNERAYGLGQGDYAGAGNGCPSDAVVVPLLRNGQTISLQQRKFHVTIPLLYSSAGFMFLFNMPGYGSVSVGAVGTGGALWRSQAALAIDFWVSTSPAGAATPAPPGPLYRQYADATGHAPLLREDALIYWQSRNRYKSSAIVESIAGRYATLGLPVGVLVVDYKNQDSDGDFAPNPQCYPSVAALSASVRETLNATTVFSFWPEVLPTSVNYAPFKAAGCLINADLGGLAIDSTIPSCRDMIWNNFLFPNYYAQGVSAYWLDETDGEGTAGGDGDHGYDTSFGPAAAYSQLWIGSWLSTFARPVAALGDAPLLLTRGVWAGGQRYGTVLWSSDIWSTFEMLRSQVNLAVHSGLSGIPWWSSDVGGYGCGQAQPDDSDYARELIVRWHEFGLFSPVFRSHGCRSGPDPEPDVAPCVGVQGSCGGNEVWSYNSNTTQALLGAMILFRRDVLKPYLSELAANVTRDGVPTARPLWWEFPEDSASAYIDDQYMLGPKILVAPVALQGATNRSVVFPAGAQWRSVWNASSIVTGGATRVVDAPLGQTPAWWRV